ncbi:MAG: alpha/beta hydrolase [Rhodospirillaceae bacterium]
MVHGAWHGGWCWRDVRNHLQDQGHRVFTPTLTGHGERIHLRHPDVNLDIHVQDIINVIKWEELENVVLVGHSYGGIIISGVCDAMKDRIAHAIYLDAGVPKDGDQVVNGRTMEDIKEIFGPLQDGFLAPPPDTTFGLPAYMEEEAAWLKRRLTPQLTGTWLSKIALPNDGSDGLPRTFIFCSDKPPLTEQQAARLQGFKDDPTWNYAELPTGHDSMVTMPVETAQMFIEIASDA